MRADFYGSVTVLARSKGSSVRWTGAAESAVNAAWGLSKYEGGEGTKMDAMIMAANDAILKDISPKLKSMLAGPALTGDAAKGWDSKTLMAEQELVQPIYDANANTPHMATYERAARHQGKFGLAPIVGPFMGANLPEYREPSLLNAQDRYNYGMRGMGYLPTLPPNIDTGVSP